MKEFKIVIEKYSDGYVAYPIGVVGAVVGQGETYEAALADVKSAPEGSEAYRHIHRGFWQRDFRGYAVCRGVFG